MTTRSAQRLKDERNASLKTRSNGAKASVNPGSSRAASNPRRSTRGMVVRQQSLSPPVNTRKSQTPDNQGGSTPLAKRKRAPDQKIPSMLRRSGSKETNNGSSSSSSRKSEKSSSSASTKKSDKSSGNSPFRNVKQRVDNGKDVKSGAKERHGSEKENSRCSVASLKRKRLDAKTYRASLRPQAKKLNQSDLGNKLQENARPSCRNPENVRTSGLQDVEDVDDKSSRKDKQSERKHSGEGREENLESPIMATQKLANGSLKNNIKETERANLNACSEKVCEPGLESPSIDSGNMMEVSPRREIVERIMNLQEIMDDVEKPKVVSSESGALAISEMMSTSLEGRLPTQEAEAEKGHRIGGSKQRDMSGLETREVCSSTAKGNCKEHEFSVSEGVLRQHPMTVTAQSDGIIDSHSHEDTGGPNVSEESAETEKLHIGPKSTQMEGMSDPLKEDRGGHGVIGATRTAKSCSNGAQSECLEENLTDGGNNVCIKCKLGGELLSCDGKDCRRSYHVYCIDPPLCNVLIGAWYCPTCVQKKLKYGALSVCDGVDTIWNVKEEMQERQYFVKYKGLSHVHNRWVAESQLLREAPLLIKKHSKEKVLWKAEWTEPQRLLRKRFTLSKIEAVVHFDSENSDPSGYVQEWLVKWKGLGYNEATWELENEPFLRSPEALMLIKQYESWREKARKQSDPSTSAKIRAGSLPELSKLPISDIAGMDCNHLNFVNKLLRNWHKYQNAIVIEEQERITKSVLFILSLESYVSRPFLVISTQSTLPQWESEFMNLAPSLNFVSYHGDKNLRESIQKLEFYDEGGSVLFQVLLAVPEAIVDDIDTLECLGWEAVIIDECLRPKLLKYSKQIISLTTGFRILLSSCPLKDNNSEYLNLLPLLEQNEADEMNPNTNYNDNSSLSVLKERLAPYVVYEHKVESSKFLEYWVPAHLSDVQMEVYCRTLVDNSMSLRSCSKNDSVGALRDMLVALRKCCDHPYLVEPLLQNTLSKGRPEVLLDIGIRSSGKLELLDRILHVLKKQKLRVLILFQTIGGSGGIGDILDDYVRQRFGQDSYERVASGLLPSKRQNALNFFNNVDTGRFIFLLENRACRSSIKLSSIDTVIIFDSDWNPMNDLRALQKIHIDSQSDQLRVFRFYSPFTVEEKSLMLSTKDVAVESNVENISHPTSHILLMWHASYLFDKLDNLHGNKRQNMNLSDISIANVVKDIVVELQDGCETNRKVSISSCIAKVRQTGAIYSLSSSLVGENVAHVTAGVPPPTFWADLLETRFPLWKYLPEASPRPRKKAKHVDHLPEKSEAENEELKRKRHRVVSNNTVDPISLQAWIEGQKGKGGSEDREAPVAETTISSTRKDPLDSHAVVNKTANSETQKKHETQLSQSFFNHNTSVLGALESDGSRNDVAEASEHPTVESEECRKARDAQKSLYLLLKPEISKLCEVLQLPEDVTDMAGKFLEYIMNNHHVNKEPKSILHAFMLSLCWRAASLLKYKVNHKEGLVRAKQLLNFECKEEEAESVYEKLRQMKRKFSRQMDSSRKLVNQTSMEQQSSAPVNHAQRKVDSKERDQQCLAGELMDVALCRKQTMQSFPVFGPPKPVFERQECSNGKSQTPVSADASATAESFTLLCRQVAETCRCREEEILEKQKKEILEFNKFKDELKEKLEKDKRLAILSVLDSYTNHAKQMEELNLVNENFDRQLKEFQKHMDGHHKELVAKQHEARLKEDKIKSLWLVEVKSGKLPELDKFPLPESGFEMLCVRTAYHQKLQGGALISGSSRKSSNVVDPTVAGTLEPILDARGPDLSCATLQPENNAEDITPSERVPVVVPEQHNCGETYEAECLVSSSQQTEHRDSPCSAEPLTGSQCDGPVLSHQVPTVGPIQHSVLSESRENMEVQTPRLDVSTSQFRECDSNISVSLSVGATQPNVSVAIASEFQSNHIPDSSAEVPSGRLASIPSTRIDQLNLSGTGALTESASNLGLGSHPLRSHLMTAVRPPPPLHSEPLKNELTKIAREKDLVTRMHEEEKNRLRTECEREIEEIRSKYNGLIHDSNVRLKQRLTVLESYYNKVYMNQILADACKFKFDPKLYSRGRQGQVSSAPMQLPSPFSQIHLAQGGPRPSRVPASAPPLQVHHSSALFSSNPAFPGYPSVVPRASTHSGAEVRAAPPHLRSVRAPTPASQAPSQLPISTMIASRQSVVNLPLVSPTPPQVPTPPSHPSSTPPVFPFALSHPSSIPPVFHTPPSHPSTAAYGGAHCPDIPSGVPPFLGSTQSALELLMDVDSRPRLNPVGLLPRLSSTFDPSVFLDVPQDMRLQAADGNGNNPPVGGSVVCLSDDD